MANTQTTKYVVTMEDGTTQEFPNLGQVGRFLGHKITKKQLEAGEYPMVSIMDIADASDNVEIIHITDDIHLHDEEVADRDQNEVPGDTDGIEVPDDSTAFAPTPELDDHTKEVLAKVAKAIDETPEDSDLFTQLCELEDSITDGVPITEAQATLLTKVLTNTLGEDATDTVDTDSEDEEDNQQPATDVEYPEVGDFKDEKAMKKYIKSLSDQSLQEWCMLEGVEWKHNDHQAINRMRMAMAIKELHFPQLKKAKGKKSKSKYAQYSTEDLVQMALDNDVEIPDDKGDARILRMYTIVALRNAGLID